MLSVPVLAVAFQFSNAGLAAIALAILAAATTSYVVVAQKKEINSRRGMAREP